MSFEVLFCYFPGGTKVSHKMLRPVYPVSWYIYDFPSTSPK